MAPSALSRFRVRQWPLASPSRLATRRPSQERASSGRTSAASRGEPAPACGEVAPSFLFAERRGRGPKVCLAPLFSPPPPAADLGTGVRAGSEGPSPRPSRPRPQSGSSVARAVRFRPRPLWPHPRVSWVEGGAGISPALPPRAARALVSGARRPAGCGVSLSLSFSSFRTEVELTSQNVKHFEVCGSAPCAHLPVSCM